MPDPRGASAFDDASQADPQPDVSGERRGGRRRKYNRRLEDQDVSPPYFETFERIAAALEQIADLLRRMPVTLPNAGAEERAENH